MRTGMKWIVPALAVVLFSSNAAAHAQYGPPPGPPPEPGYRQGGWDVAPPEFRAAQQQGFHDGVEGARKDVQNRRFPNVNNRDEFRHPHVPRDLRADYRQGFERGYDVAMRHLLNGGAGQRPY